MSSSGEKVDWAYATKTLSVDELTLLAEKADTDGKVRMLAALLKDSEDALAKHAALYESLTNAPLMGEMASLLHVCNSLNRQTRRAMLASLEEPKNGGKTDQTGG